MLPVLVAQIHRAYKSLQYDRVRFLQPHCVCSELDLESFIPPYNQNLCEQVIGCPEAPSTDFGEGIQSAIVTVRQDYTPSCVHS